jgi:hypothetical protein
MSCNRENVTWQAEDGTWSIGFFDFHAVGQDSPDWDFEWDVEYDFSRFNWTSHGHATPDGAYEAWDGANPGGTMIVRRDEDPAACAEYDQMARARAERELRNVEAELAGRPDPFWRAELASRRRELEKALRHLAATA